MDERLTFKPSILKMLQVDIKNALEVTGINKNFLNRTETAPKIVPRTNKWDMKLKNRFCLTRESMSRTNSLHTGRKPLPVKPQTGD